MARITLEELEIKNQRLCNRLLQMDEEAFKLREQLYRERRAAREFKRLACDRLGIPFDPGAIVTNEELLKALG